MYYKEDNDLFRRKTSISYYDVMTVNSYESFLTSIQFFNSKQDFTYRKHCHPSYEFVIPRSGDYKCLLNGQEMSVRVGEVLLGAVFVLIVLVMPDGIVPGVRRLLARRDR